MTHKYTKIGVLLLAYGTTTYTTTTYTSHSALTLSIITGIFYIIIGKNKEKKEGARPKK